MVRIDKNSRTPVYVQLYTEMKRDIMENLQGGSRLPSIREMAKRFSLSINTVNKAYQQLLVEGYIYSVPGSGFYCNEVEHTIYEGSSVAIQEHRIFPKVQYDFVYGSADNREFPWNEWKKCVKEALLIEELETVVHYEDRQGRYDLRCSLAAHLKETRGVVCKPEQIVVCSGLQQSLEIIAKLLPPSQYELAFEEPGYDVARLTFEGNNYRINSISVDREGLHTNELKKTRCNLVYVTPSHQFPLGVVMSIARRQELIKIMHERNGYIIEDDYDSEFRYGTLAIPSLQSLSGNDRVLYIGSFSKSLSPAMRTSYLVLPPDLLKKYQNVFAKGKSTVPDLIQLAICEFLERGYYAKHLRKMIVANEERYRATIQSFAQEKCPYINYSSMDSGLHLLIEIDSALSPEEMLSFLIRNGIRLYPTDSYWVNKENHNSRLFLMGFAIYTPDEIQKGVTLLCNLVSEVNKRTHEK